MRQKLWTDLKQPVQCKRCACDRWKKITVRFNVPVHTQCPTPSPPKFFFSTFFFSYTNNNNYMLTHASVPRITNNSIDELKKKMLLVLLAPHSAAWWAHLWRHDRRFLPHSQRPSIFSLSLHAIFFTLVHGIAAVRRDGLISHGKWTVIIILTNSVRCGTTTTATAAAAVVHSYEWGNVHIFIRKLL